MDMLDYQIAASVYIEEYGILAALFTLENLQKHEKFEECAAMKAEIDRRKPTTGISSELTNENYGIAVRKTIGVDKNGGYFRIIQ